MYRVAGLKCLTHIYTGFHTSRDKGSLMKLLPLDLRFPKSKLRQNCCTATNAGLQNQKAAEEMCQKDHRRGFSLNPKR